MRTLRRERLALNKDEKPIDRLKNEAANNKWWQEDEFEKRDCKA